MRALHVIEAAYRGTIEEQDDTIIWLTHSMRDAGADLEVLLRGNAVTYALPNQTAVGLEFGNWRQTQPPKIASDVADLIFKGVPVYVLAEDVKQRGLNGEEFVDGVQIMSCSSLPEYFEKFEHVWHW